MAVSSYGLGDKLMSKVPHPIRLARALGHQNNVGVAKSSFIQSNLDPENMHH